MSARFLIRLGMAATAGFAALTQRDSVAMVLEALADARLAPLAIAVALSLASVANRGAMYRAAHRSVEIDTPYAPMVRVAAASYALNKMVKTGGAGGVTLFVRHGSQRNHPPGAVTAAYLLAGLGAQIGLVIVFAAALGSAVLTGSLHAAWIGAAAGIVFYTGVGVVLGALAMQSRDRLHRIQALLCRLAGRAPWRRERIQAAADSMAGALNDFFDAVQLAKRKRRSLARALAHATADKLLGAAVLGCSLVATGGEMGIGPALVSTVLTVYVVALAVAMVGVLPGGFGAVEASMGALLIGQGIPPAIAGAGIVVFRLIDMWLPLAVGSLAARSLVRRGTRPEPETDVDAAGAKEASSGALGTAPARTRAPLGLLDPVVAPA